MPPRHPQIAHREQHRHASCVLGQAAIADLGMAELLFDHPKGVFHLRPDAGLQLLQPLLQPIHFAICLQRAALARAHGNGSRALSLFLVELGAAMIVASTTVPVRSIRPCSARWALMVASTCDARACRSKRWRKRRIVVSSGMRAAPSSPAKRRYTAGARAVLLPRPDR